MGQTERPANPSISLDPEGHQDRLYPVQRRPSSTSGNTTASRVKSLLLHIERRFGRPEADAFLLTTRLDRDYLDDETRPVPVEVWHAALVAFASRWGRDEISKTTPAIVAAENLGVWTRVLRGATNPLTAFRQMDQYGGEDLLTERWQTIIAEPGRWQGRIPLRVDPAHERDGLCASARATELASVPVLFGLEPGEVRVLPAEPEHTGGAAQRLEVRWNEQGTLPIWIGAGTGSTLAVAAALGLPLDVGAALGVAAVSAALGVGAGLVVLRDRRRRAQSRSQLIRLQALERAATLRDQRERGAAGFREGAVVAGQYRLGNKLGVGASGAIWEAVRLCDGSVVAIKLLRAAVAHDTVAADRLRREAAALGLAWHPNVVEVYEDGHLPDGTCYLVMERLYGESLALRLRRRGALPPADVLPIALQVCDALGAVHAAGVVHRDLKPSNIYLAEPDPARAAEEDDSSYRSLSCLPTGERVKILDFGVARVEWAETRLTNMDAPLGTPGYMSPEQEQGAEIDHRSDLFALGGVLFECLSGHPPPMRTSDLWEAYPALDVTQDSGVQRAVQTVPEPWRRVIERAMAPLPRDRYADSRAMRDAIAALAACSSPRSSRPPMPVPQKLQQKP
jgi:serine/threonine-protein kinase